MQTFVLSLGGYEATKALGQDTQYLPPDCSQTQDGCRKNCHQTEDERVTEWKLLHSSDAT